MASPDAWVHCFPVGTEVAAALRGTRPTEAFAVEEDEWLVIVLIRFRE